MMGFGRVDQWVPNFQGLLLGCISPKFPAFLVVTLRILRKLSQRHISQTSKTCYQPKSVQIRNKNSSF